MFKKGEIVKYKAAFLKSCGWHTNVPIDGLVEEDQKNMFVNVRWSDMEDGDPPRAVHHNNILLVSKPDYSGM